MNKIKEVALDYVGAGISVLPIRETKVGKKPAVTSWKAYQEELPDPSGWKDNIDGLGMICGRVSGNIEVIDFDHQHGMTDELYTQFKIEVGPEIVGKLLIQKTPSGGRHWVYRLEEGGIVKPNTKLCAGPDGEACIETRGEGGYIHIVPTAGYGWVRGIDPVVANGEMGVLSVEERDFIWGVARSGKYGVAIPEKKVYKGLDKGGAGGHMFRAKEVPVFHSAFIEYNKRVNIRELVEADGWEYLDEGVDSRGVSLSRYCRAGGDGVGASLYKDAFYVFTTASGLPQQSMMSAAEYVMYRDFGGDEGKMLAWLRDEHGINGDENLDGFGVAIDGEKQKTKVKREVLFNIGAFNKIYKARYNVIKEQLEVIGKDGKTWVTKNHYEVKTAFAMQGLKLKLEDVKEIVMNKDHFVEVDPVVEYLNGVSKVGAAGAIDKLSGYVTCADQGRWQEGFKRHLVRCVRQVMLAGVSGAVNRYALILHSTKQGNGKSRFLRYVLNGGITGGEQYYTENLPKDNDPNATARFLSMNTMVNMEELDGFVKREIDTLKALTTQSTAQYRKLFTDNLITLPRRVNFWGSTNKASFLSDVSNTRWMIHEVVGIDWGYEGEVNIDHVWGEAVRLYKSGYACDLSTEEIGRNEEVADSHKREKLPSEWITGVFTLWDGDKGVDHVALTPSEILGDLVLYYRASKGKDEMIAKELEKIGVTYFGTILNQFGMGTKRTKRAGKVYRCVKVVVDTDFERDKVYADSHAFKWGGVNTD